jgi:hypothetical protein
VRDLDIPIGAGRILAISTIRRDPDDTPYLATLGRVYTIDAGARVTRGLAVTGPRRGLAFYYLPPTW